MEEYRKTFRNFLALHALKGGATNTPSVHVAFHTAGGPCNPAAPLLLMTEEELPDVVDFDCELVRWLLHQLRTYDCRTQKIIALVFDRKTVMSDVLRCT